MRHSIFLMNPNKSDEVRKERHWFNPIRDYGMKVHNCLMTYSGLIVCLICNKDRPHRGNLTLDIYSYKSRDCQNFTRAPAITQMPGCCTLPKS